MNQNEKRTRRELSFRHVSGTEKSPPAFCERTARETKFFKCDDFILEWYPASEYHIIWNNVLTVYVYHQMNRNNCCVAPGEIVPIIRAHKIN